jgi:hypothetical protein
MQEHLRRLDVLSRAQRKVEPVGVADDDRAGLTTTYSLLRTAPGRSIAA